MTVNVEIPEKANDLFAILPLNIRKKYMQQLTNAMVADNEKKIIEGVMKLISELTEMSLSNQDETDMNELLEGTIKDLGIVKSLPKIKLKKNKTIKKKPENESEIDEIELKDNISGTLPSFEEEKSKEKTSELSQSKSVENSEYTSNDNVDDLFGNVEPNHSSVDDLFDNKDH